MDNTPLLLFTFFTLLCTAYAHLQLPQHSTTPRQVWLSRLLLVLIGLGFGWAMLRFYGRPQVVGGQMENLPRSLIFLSAFGLAHVPAAAILFLKSLRNRSRP